ncbi:MAG TPA: tetratricopeptide repeat protein [Rubrivivax sp.]
MTTDPQAAPTAANPGEPTHRPSARLRTGSAIFVLVVGAVGYLWTGSPSGIPGGAPPPGFAQQQDAEDPALAASAAAEFNVMVERLAARLKDKPDDAVGHAMLGRSYLVLGRYDEAVAAYERALKIEPQQASLIVDYAEAVAMKNGRTLEGEPLRLIDRALKIDPAHLKGLSLAGAAAFNREDYAGAVARWDRVVAIGPADDPLVQNARESAVQAREAGKLPPAPAGPAVAAAAADAAVSGTVSLSPALKAAAAPDDTVFIFARAAEGPRMPLAILRKQVKDLPFDFRLDDSLAMSPAMRLSTAPRVVVGARISKSGQAMPQPGDLEGLTAPVAVGASGLKIEITTPVK